MAGRFLRLGINIDHVATIRNARGGSHPDPVRAAHVAANTGADGITAHLREDRRHINDNDIERLIEQIRLPLNLELAATVEMLEIALRYRPHAACIVPEKREERTTEGGLDVRSSPNAIRDFVTALSEGGIRVSLFVEPDLAVIDTAKDIGAPVVELHTGTYCNAAVGPARDAERTRIAKAAAHADNIDIECHAGHGLGFATVAAIAEIDAIVELNIGHFLIGEAIFGGLESNITRMRALMDKARADAMGNCNN